MITISKARFTLEDKLVSVEEYEKILLEHPAYNCEHFLICPMCGDELILAKGDINVHHFRHKVSENGHDCELYFHGANKDTPIFRYCSKILNEYGIVTNYELLLINDKTLSAITFPPLNSKELANHISNDSRIHVKAGMESFELAINDDSFNVGQLKTITFRGCPSTIHLTFSSKNGPAFNKKISGFNPWTQIFKCPKLENYIKSSNSTYKNESIFNELAFRKMDGKIYVGRHYFIFSTDDNYFRNGYFLPNTIHEKIQQRKIMDLDFYIYDVVFTEIDNKNQAFCSKRNCFLCEDNEAVLLWPPFNTIGDRKIFYTRGDDKTTKSLFLSYQNESNIIELNKTDLKNKNFYIRISNPHSPSFYLMRKDYYDKNNEGTNNLFKVKTVNIENPYYRFKNNALLEKVLNKSDVKLKKNELLLDLNDRLKPNIYIKNIEAKEVDLLDVIKYSPQQVEFTDNDYKRLKTKYKGNELLQEYFRICKVHKKINELALSMLDKE